MDDRLYEKSIGLILYVQRTLGVSHGIPSLVQWISLLGTPTVLMRLLVPASFLVDNWTPVKVAAALSYTDLLSLILSNVFRGHRPYWWVHERFDKSERLLEQFPVICEPTFGNPSRHVMITTAVGMIMALELQRFLRQLERFGWLNKVNWLFYATFTFCSCLARLYLGTNFIHQLLLGALGGASLGWLIYHMPWQLTRAKHFVVSWLFLVAWYWSSLQTLKYLSQDYHYAERMAHDACKDPTWVQANADQWFILSQNLGIILGLALASLTPHYRNSDWSAGKRMICVTLTFGLVQVLSTIHLFPFQAWYTVLVESLLGTFLSFCLVPLLLGKFFFKLNPMPNHDWQSAFRKLSRNLHAD